MQIELIGIDIVILVGIFVSFYNCYMWQVKVKRLPIITTCSTPNSSSSGER